MDYFLMESLRKRTNLSLGAPELQMELVNGLVTGLVDGFVRGLLFVHLQHIILFSV